MRSLRRKPDRSCAPKPGHISCQRQPSELGLLLPQWDSYDQSHGSKRQESEQAQVRSHEVGPAQVRTDVRGAATPLVPGLHALVEQRKMLLVRHGTPLLGRSVSDTAKLEGEADHSMKRE